MGIIIPVRLTKYYSAIKEVNNNKMYYREFKRWQCVQKKKNVDAADSDDLSL